MERRDLKLQKLDDYRWLIPREGKMRTDGLIYVAEEMLDKIRQEDSSFFRGVDALAEDLLKSAVYRNNNH